MINALKKINSKKILYIFTLAILVFLPILKQASFYFVKFGWINNFDSINPAYVLYICLPFLVFVYISNIVVTKRSLDKFDYLLYILIGSSILATIFSLDFEVALIGKAYRHEGFFTILTYYMLFIDWKVYGTKEDIKKILNVIIIMGIINAGYAFLQLYTKSTNILRYSNDKQMAAGICGNPNFFGTLMVTVLSIVTSKFLIDKKISKFNLFLVIFFFFGLIAAQSTGPFVTYIITLIFLIIYLIIKKKIIIKNIIYLLLILPITFFGILFVNKELFNIEKCEMCDFANSILKKDEVQENTPSNVDPATIYSVTNGRMDIWKKGLKIVSKYPINGVGYDNFYLAYYEGIDLNEVVFINQNGEFKAVRKYTEIIDNAHNVYLQTLISTGFVGFIPYLILCLLAFINALKTKENLVILLLGGFVAYSIQAFANINVLQVAPVYYVIIGLILSIKK